MTGITLPARPTGTTLPARTIGITLRARAITGALALTLLGNTALAQTDQSSTASEPDSAAFLREILAAVEGSGDAGRIDPAVAAEIGQAGTTAAGAIEANDADAAIAALEDAIETVAEARPFGVRRAILVGEEVEAFGEATPRPDNAYGSEETVTLYVEPVGYDFAGSEGAYTVELSGDYALLSPSEQILLVGQADFARFDFEAETKTQDLFLTISYTLRDLRPGTYTIVTRLNDLNGGDSTSFRTPIRIVDGTAPAADAAPAETTPTQTVPVETPTVGTPTVETPGTAPAAAAPAADAAPASAETAPTATQTPPAGSSPN